MAGSQRKPSQRKPSQLARINRRDLLSGRIWKLLDRQAREPLVMRYPRSRADVTGAAGHTASQASAADAVPTIQGIAISPVPVTPLHANASRTRMRAVPVFRPPGAIEEASFLAGCTRCSDCLDACPHSAIIHAPLRLQAIAGTPIVDPDTQPCLMCQDFPCIAACQPGVLRSDRPKLMGTARVTQHLCLAHHGTTCTVCSERCPVAGAISVADGKPTVNETTCTGCGVCRYVCPAPENAILLMPTFSRP